MGKESDVKCWGRTEHETIDSLSEPKPAAARTGMGIPFGVAVVMSRQLENDVVPRTGSSASQPASQHLRRHRAGNGDGACIECDHCVVM